MQGDELGPWRCGVIVASMLARLQKIITFSLMAAVLGVAWWLLFLCNSSLVSALAACLALLLLSLGAYAATLAVEFGFSSIVNARSACPVPTWRETLSAWSHEVIAGPMLFCWRQPFRTNAVPDRLVPTPHGHGQQGLVFVHGFFCNRAFWSPWMARLQGTGRVYEAISLEPVFGCIDDYLLLVNDAVKRVTHATGVPPLLVCHSMGGLAVRAWLAGQPADGPVYHVVTIGTPHRGTWLARWGRSHNARQMQQGSDWLTRLNNAQAARPLHKFTCWYSTADNIVFPSSTATLPGADNRQLQGVAHVQMAFLPQVMDETLAMLKNRAV